MFIGDNKFFKVLLSAEEFALKSALVFLTEERMVKAYGSHKEELKHTLVYGFAISKNDKTGCDRLGFYMHGVDSNWVSEGKKKIFQPFIAPMKPTELVGQIMSWLNTVEYPPRYDIDGDLGKGFYLQRPGTSYYAEDFDFYVDPIWCQYHK